MLVRDRRLCHAGARRPRCIPAALLAACSLAAVVSCGGGASSRAVPARASASFSPYVDVTLASARDLPALARRAGVRSLTLAFVVGRAGACQPGWGGSRPLSTVPVQAVDALRARGTQVVISLGGRDGPEPAHACASSAPLTRVYRMLVDAYRPARLDFDIEGNALADRRAAARRWSAVAAVQAYALRRGHPVAVSLTLPVDTNGLAADARAQLQAALRAGVTPSLVNLLTFDYGPPPVLGDQVALAERAARAAVGQLPGALGSTSATRWRHVALTPMIGVNDVYPEIFYVNDAPRLARLARVLGAGGLSMWSLGRDTACPPGTPAGAQADCSGVAQSPFSFARALGAA